MSKKNRKRKYKKQKQTKPDEGFEDRFKVQASDAKVKYDMSGCVFKDYGIRAADEPPEKSGKVKIIYSRSKGIDNRSV